MTTEVKVFKIPNCDYCLIKGREVPAQYDARSVEGPWMAMCHTHWVLHRLFDELGLGKGQKFVHVPAPRETV